MYGKGLYSRTPFTPVTRNRIPDWKRQLEEAVRELDPDRLTARVYDAEWAIFQRWQEMGARSGNSEERAALAQAVEQLHSIKIYKLNWPDFRSHS